MLGVSLTLAGFATQIWQAFICYGFAGKISHHTDPMVKQRISFAFAQDNCKTLYLMKRTMAEKMAIIAIQNPSELIPQTTAQNTIL